MVKFTVLFLIFYFFTLNLTQSDPEDEEKETQIEAETDSEPGVDVIQEEQNIHDIKDKIILEEENVK